VRALLVVMLISCAPAKPAPPVVAPVAAKPSCASGTIAVPAGSFVLAKSKQAVTVAAHCIDRTEVTVRAYAKCVEKGECTLPDAHDDDHRWCNWKSDREDDPINCVDQAQASAYCASLSARLPSEAEWEWSARGYESGTTYPWGNEPPADRACWDGPGNKVSATREGTCPVGSFASGANPKGVLDLAGNVWEWTSTDAATEGHALDKGGGYPNAVPTRLFAGEHNEVEKKQRASTLGFRCVRAL
jgi:formylglycine-generating enzyme required for sulfatase activity